jgi:hypothetical protein
MHLSSLILNLSVLDGYHGVIYEGVLQIFCHNAAFSIAKARWKHKKTAVYFVHTCMFWAWLAPVTLLAIWATTPARHNYRVFNTQLGRKIFYNQYSTPCKKCREKTAGGKKTGNEPKRIMHLIRGRTTNNKKIKQKQPLEP